MIWTIYGWLGSTQVNWDGCFFAQPVILVGSWVQNKRNEQNEVYWNRDRVWIWNSAHSRNYASAHFWLITAGSSVECDVIDFKSLCAAHSDTCVEEIRRKLVLLETESETRQSAADSGGGRVQFAGSSPVGRVVDFARNSNIWFCFSFDSIPNRIAKSSRVASNYSRTSRGQAGE